MKRTFTASMKTAHFHTIFARVQPDLDLSRYGWPSEVGSHLQARVFKVTDGYALDPKLVTRLHDEAEALKEFRLLHWRVSVKEEIRISDKQKKKFLTT